jgi:hypothetical protein
MIRAGRFRSRAVLSLLLFLFLLPVGPAFAQVDWSGLWNPVGSRQITDNPDIGDYAGFPLSDAGRRRAQTWAANMMEVAQNVCRPYPLEMAFAPSNMRVWTEVDKTSQTVIAYHQHFFYHEEERTIWMDGRPHPPEYAAHTWAGFSTGEWQGDTLVITTTHLKENFLVPNGTTSSDRRTLRTYIKRYGNYLSSTSIVFDPAYLTEPLIRIQTWVNDPQMVMNPYPCEQATETLVVPGQYPNYMPGKNPLLTDFAARRGIPPEAVTSGSAEAMYPDYIKKMKTMKVLPRPVATADSGEAK